MRGDSKLDSFNIRRPLMSTFSSYTFKLALLTGLIFSNAAMARETFEGELIHVVEDYDDHHKEYAILRDEKTKNIKKLKMSSDELERTLRKYKSGQYISVTGSMKNDELEVSNVTPLESELAEDLVSRPNVYQSGSRSVLVVAVNFQSDVPACNTESAIKTITMDSTNPKSMLNFFKENSHGAFGITGRTVSVTIDVNLDTDRSCSTMIWSKAADAALLAKGIDPAQYDHNMYILPTRVGCGFGGQAYVGANLSWVKQCNEKTFSHELGHNFGLHHSASTIYEYGDYSDTMGGQFMQFAAPKREQLGWIKDSRIKIISASGSHQIAPLNQAPDASSTPQILKVWRESSQDYLYISYRDKSGTFDSNMLSSFANKVSLHTFKSGNKYDVRSYHLGSMALGEGYALRELGINIKVDALNSSGATISFTQEEITTCTEYLPSIKVTDGYPVVEQGQVMKGKMNIINNSTKPCTASNFSFSARLSHESLSYTTSTSRLNVPAGEERILDYDVQTTRSTPIAYQYIALLPSVDKNHYYFQQYASTTFRVIASSSTDTTPPSVSINSPASGAEFSVGSSVDVSMSASDNIGVSSVKLYANNVLKCTDLTSPYTCSFPMIEGSVELKATAIDAAGNQTSIVRMIKSKAETGDTTPPSVSIISPASGSEFSVGSSVSVSMSASDNVGVSSVKLYANNILKCTDTTSPYSCSFPMIEGSVELKAIAVDAAGNQSSAVRMIKSKVEVVDTQAPTIPANLRISVKGKNNVSLSFSASSDNVGVTGYQIFRDGLLLGSSSSTSYSDSKVPEGPHSYSVRALDAAGNKSALSGSVSITIGNGRSGDGKGSPGKGKNK
jgi:hypothetical protein